MDNVGKRIETEGKDIAVVIYEALYSDGAQGRMSELPKETRTHSCRFASRACKSLHHQGYLK